MKPIYVKIKLSDLQSVSDVIDRNKFLEDEVRRLNDLNRDYLNDIYNLNDRINRISSVGSIQDTKQFLDRINDLEDENRFLIAKLNRIEKYGNATDRQIAIKIVKEELPGTIDDPKKIPQIKRYKEVTGYGLRDSKNEIEAAYSDLGLDSSGKPKTS